jgi:hypothetical protein
VKPDAEKDVPRLEDDIDDDPELAAATRAVLGAEAPAAEEPATPAADPLQDLLPAVELVDLDQGELDAALAGDEELASVGDHLGPLDSFETFYLPPYGWN